MSYTINDIAERAGVSKSTVSRVITNSGYTSMETRQKVWKVIEELKYQPNGLARAMVSQQTNTIGVIIMANHYPVISHPFYGKVLDGILEAADHYRYSVIVTTEKEMSLSSTEDMIIKRVDGIILISRLQDEVIDFIDKYKVPYIMVNGTTEKQNVINIVNDDMQGGMLAADHLFQSGYRNIGVIVGPQEHRSHSFRYKGFSRRLKELGCQLNENMVDQTKNSKFESGREAFLAIWERSHNKPDAIFATNDILAFGAIREMNHLGLKVPDDIAVMGFDNIDFTEISTPSITTVHIEKTKMGYDAVTVLEQIIKRQEVKLEMIEYKPRLIERESTRKREI